MPMHRRNKFILPILLLYISSLIIGIAVVFAIPYISRKNQLQKMAEHSADSYASQRSIRHINDYGISYLIYDSEGNCIEKSIVRPRISDDDFPAERYLKELSTTAYFQHYAFFKTDYSDNYSRIIPDPYFVCGHTIVDIDHTTVGALLIIRPLPDLLHNMFGYIISLTFFFLMLGIFLYLYRKKENELEERERMYLAGMNHELKSPITSIKALSETLLDGMVTDAQKRLLYYSTILREANRLEATVQNILDFTRLQTGTVSYPKERASFEEVFGDMIQRYQELQQDLDFILHTPDSSANGLQLFTNKELAAQLLDLLLHNATKFIETDGEIWIDLRVRKKQAVISVRDNGCGISKTELPHVFERFYQVERSHNSNGSGLGLSIARGITEYLEESIWIESEAGCGTVVSFTVMLAARRA